MSATPRIRRSASRRRPSISTVLILRPSATSRSTPRPRTATTTTWTETATAWRVRAMTTRALAAIAGVVVALALAGAGAVAVAGGKAPVAPTIGGFEDVNFVSLCRFSHTGADDPIVFPGRPGLSHDHTFFGNTTTNANSTPAGLLTQQTTCDPTTDNAAYWAPTLFVNDKKVEALDAAIY